MRLWTLQAAQVVDAVRDNGVYRADWQYAIVNWRPAYRAMVAEMERRGIACHGAAPVWCWPGRALRPRATRSTANSLLGLDQWARGVYLIKLDVPAALTMTTSYARWNDYLGVTMELLRAAGRTDGPAFPPEQAPMDWSATLEHEWDNLQVVIPELRREWVVRSRYYAPDAETAASIAADPDLTPSPVVAD
ncbi:DUF3841 domain-containing protein [Nocardia cyriacigeorgica]|uniref:DUF3841 domain-containing protein n=1 Tax=Nocardia cyriacigeorgica TaxID=135487 RepID=UPI0018959C85|nr:DUF3841 domain-containing protein [Nocardia cyriacigeorgica]MBF6435752.1 DUF3841 domain-containing protein [Nocardia cyriacigeorgica]